MIDAKASGTSRNVSLSPDGRYAAFESSAPNLVAQDFNDRTDVFRSDQQTGQLSLISVNADHVPGDDDSFSPSMSADYRWIAFVSSATNLVEGDANGVADVFVRDMQLHTTTRISVAAGGAQADAPSGEPSISADGRYVAFSSTASNLVPDDTNTSRDVFRWDRVTSTLQRVSIPEEEVEANGPSSEPSVASTGDVAFESSASNLVTSDTNGFQDVFVFRAATNAVVLASRYGGQGLDDESGSPSISDQGECTAFESRAILPNANDDDDDPDIFVWEKLVGTGIPRPVSATPYESNTNPAISSNCTSVAYEGRSGSDTTQAVISPTSAPEASWRAASYDNVLGFANGDSTNPSRPTDDSTTVGFETVATNLGGPASTPYVAVQSTATGAPRVAVAAKPSKRVAADTTPPRFAHNFEVWAKLEPSTGTAIVSWDAAQDQPLADGSLGSGLQKYHYDYSEFDPPAGDCSTFAPGSTAQFHEDGTELERAVLPGPGAHEGARLFVKIYAVDQVGNTSAGKCVELTISGVGNRCDATASGYPPACADPNPIEEDNEPSVDIVPDTEAVASRNGTDAFVHRVRVASGGWTTIRRYWQSYAIGNAHHGWSYDQVDQNYEGTNGWVTGRINGNFGSCGWVKAAPDPGRSTRTSCPADYRPIEPQFSDSVNCLNCDHGAIRKVVRPAPQCRNVSPTPVNHTPIRCENRAAGRLDADDLFRIRPDDYVVRWRYETNGKKFVMVNDQHWEPGASRWVFMPRWALGQNLCTKMDRRYECAV